jgi:hypothetical protein
LELTPAPVVGAAPSGKLTINHQFIYKAIQWHSCITLLSIAGLLGNQPKPKTEGAIEFSKAEIALICGLFQQVSKAATSLLYLKSYY